jgi:hypothetical protein
MSSPWEIFRNVLASSPEDESNESNDTTPVQLDFSELKNASTFEQMTLVYNAITANIGKNIDSFSDVINMDNATGEDWNKLNEIAENWVGYVEYLNSPDSNLSISETLQREGLDHLAYKFGGSGPDSFYPAQLSGTFGFGATPEGGETEKKIGVDLNDVGSRMIHHLDSRYPGSFSTSLAKDFVYKGSELRDELYGEIFDPPEDKSWTENFVDNIFTFDATQTKRPDLLKVYLGLEENPLTLSEDQPTSWTKHEDVDLYSMKDSGYADAFWWDPSKITKIHEDKWGDKISVKMGYINELFNKEPHNLTHNDKAVNEEIFGKAFLGGDPGSYTTSFGYDEEKDQYYMSILDIYDFAPEDFEYYKDEYMRYGQDDYTYGGGRNSMKNELDKLVQYYQYQLMDATGDPVGMYDRFYMPKEVEEEWKGILKDYGLSN